MDNSGFKTRVHAKCILAGEHAVLRGHPAIVLPVTSKYFELTYQPQDNILHADFDAPYGETLLVLLWGTLNSCISLLRKPATSLTGNFFLKNNIPMGSGLGFSAALCVAVAQWAVWRGWLESYRLFDFARELENHFHGKSSGLDIAGTLAHVGTYFNINGHMRTVEMKWQPKLYLSSSNHQSSTAKCVEKVQSLWQQDEILAQLVDQQMANSVLKIEHALDLNEAEGLLQLAAAINQANQCFKQWGLITPELESHVENLLTNGALAVKPTGSGSGGYVLSLWREPPPADFPYEMLPLSLESK